MPGLKGDKTKKGVAQRKGRQGKMETLRIFYVRHRGNNVR
jgi:hypothetical protein